MPVKRRTLTAAMMLPALAQAQAPAWPSHPVRLVLPSAAGGNPDIVARIWAQRLTETLGQNFVVENRPGAAGIVGADAAMQAAPDGYTLMFGFNQLATLNRLLYRRLPYNPATMTPIARLTRTAFVMMIPKAMGITDPEEFFALAKRRPGMLVHGTSGPGSISHLFNEMLRRDLGVDLLHVPYRSIPIAELTANQVQLLVEPAALAVSLTQGAGAMVQALAQLGPAPDPALPGVPRLGEKHPGFVITGWHAIWGPPGLPAPLAARISAAFVNLAHDAWLAQKLNPLATYPNVLGPDGLRDSTRQDLALWEGIVRERGIALD